MAEWHLAPEYIVEHWTDELFLLMRQKRDARICSVVKAMRPQEPTPPRELSDFERFAMRGIGRRN